MGDERGETLLIIGGIHGNEQGSYLAPALFLQHYKILKGRVTVIPNLNPESIRNHNRGTNGDMNRKFHYVSKKDGDYDRVQEIKELILNLDLSILLNLHDGSGVFLNNWYRWGQSIVIDEESVPAKRYGYLKHIADEVVRKANSRVPNQNYLFGVKNTETAHKSPSMQKTLTYFAYKNRIPAFGVEASKELSDSERVFHHLLIIEEFLKLFDIEFKRDFELSIKNVKMLLQDLGTLSINENFTLSLSKIRKRLYYIPMSWSSNFTFSHPLGNFKKRGRYYDVYVGYKKITTLKPQYFRVSKKIDSVKIEVDGVIRNVELGSQIEVKNSFKVLERGGVRVNVIGFRKRGVRNESGIKISRKDIESRFSLDLNRREFRVEVYGRKGIFYGMVVVKFQ
jgi:hypothetical protein